MPNWYELEIKTAHGWGVVMPPSLRVHGGLVDAEGPRRYETKEAAIEGARHYGKPIELCRIYECNNGGRWRVVL